MPLYKPQDLRAFLREMGHGAKRSLSQNFLIDGNIAHKIIETLDPKPGDCIIEIGPGPGVLTEILLQSDCSVPCHVLAIEKDIEFANALPRLEMGSSGRLTVVCADVLSCDFRKLITENFPAGKKVKLVSNLPYHLTTSILEHILRFRELFSSLTVMVQNEVGKKITASERMHIKDVSPLTLMLSYYASLKYAFFVSRHCFSPSPNVDSCVVHMDIKGEFPLSHGEDEDRLFHMIRHAFSQRRKTLFHSLKGMGGVPDIIQEALKEAGVSVTCRPEELPVHAWISLFTILKRENFFHCMRQEPL